MSDQLVMPAFNPLVYSIFRDAIIEALKEKSIEDFVEEIIHELNNWQALEDHIQRQTAKRFSLLLDEDEKRTFILNLVSHLSPFSAIDQTSVTDNDVVGGIRSVAAEILKHTAAVIGAHSIVEITQEIWNAVTGRNVDPNCVSTVKEIIQGKCFEWCINNKGFKHGEPKPCSSGSE